MSRDENLQQMVEQLARLYEILLALGRDVAPQNPALYAVMAEGPADQIEQMKRQIDEAVGLTSLQEQRADVWLNLEGQGLEVQSTPSSLLASYLDVVRRGVLEVAEVNVQGRLSAHPQKDLKEACDLELVALQPGSIRIGLRLPDPRQEGEDHELPESWRAAAGALGEYLEVAAWAAQGGGEQWLLEKFPEPVKRRVLLTAVKSLAPTGRTTVDTVSLSGRRVSGSSPVTLTRKTSRRLGRVLEQLEEPRPRAYEGVLREIDLDKKTFLIRSAQPERIVRCSFPPDLSELAKQALDHRVRVTGTACEPKGRQGTVDLKVQDLTILER